MRQLRIRAEVVYKVRFGRVHAPNTGPLPQTDRLAFCLELNHDNSSSAYTCLSLHNGTSHVAPKYSAYGSYGSFFFGRALPVPGYLVDPTAHYPRETRCGR
jgi:hypothetical protein